MKATRAFLQTLSDRADALDWAVSDRAQLIRQIMAELKEAVQEDERQAHTIFDQALTLPEAARRCGVPYSTIARQVQRGVISSRNSDSGKVVVLKDMPCAPGFLLNLLAVEMNPSESVTFSAHPFTEQELETYRGSIRRVSAPPQKTARRRTR